MLHPEAMVTLGGERAATDVDEVLANLARELAGLLPVKEKVAEIAALLLVDRVRQKFGLSAPRPNLHMCFYRRARHREDHGGAAGGRSAAPPRLPGKGHLVHAI